MGGWLLRDLSKRRFSEPSEALLGPRELLSWLLMFRRALGLPEPDAHWRSTAQVNWTATPRVPFWTRFFCLYLGHDMQRVKVRKDGLTHRLDCARCGWEGPYLS